MDQVPLLLRAAVSVGLLSVIVHLCSRPAEKRANAGLPIVGLRKDEWLSDFRSLIRSIFRLQQWASDGYATYCKAARPFIVPTIDRGDVAVIPPPFIKKLYNSPERDIDMSATASNTLQEMSTVWDSKVVRNLLHMKVIQNQITRNLGILTPIIASEFVESFKRVWGVDTEKWRELDVWYSSIQLIGAAANGAFLGAPLCRDEDFLAKVRDHSMNVVWCAMLINTSPPPLKWLAKGFVKLFCYGSYQRTCRSKLLPAVRERMAHVKKLKEDPSYEWTPPSDGMQWIIDESYACGDPEQVNPDTVCHRLLHMNIVSLHSTSFTAQNVILDLFNTDPADGVIETLREEATRVLAEAGGEWTRAAVQKLVLTDSAVRESMRMNPFAVIGLPRTIVRQGGMTIPGTDIHLDEGTTLSVPLEPIHMDESIYPDARRYTPFRFASPDMIKNLAATLNINGGEAGSAGGEDGAATTKPKSGVTLDDAFLGFGFGRHACPGRFFALNEVKIFVAHALLNYDVELCSARPKSVDIIWLKTPMHHARVRVRRRVGTL